MKPILYFSLFLSLHLFCHAQSAEIPLPCTTLIPHYVLSVSYNSTTVLIFPAAVKPQPIDRGDRDILAQKQPGVENVLKLKAARKNFPPTNLHVFTADGRVYAFDVFYTDSLASTRDLTALGTPANYTTQTSLIILSAEPLNSDQMGQYVNKLRRSPVRKSGPADRKNKMSLQLENVAQGGPYLFFKFRLENHSNLDYTLDFMRLYIRDQQKAKRTSVQEREISPIYEDSTFQIPGDSGITHILAVPAFTLAGGKQFIVEAYEKNGGRSLTLYIKNKALFKARRL
jgi:conjugative transposon TraN protein